jgi:hypothetical protein
MTAPIVLNYVKHLIRSGFRSDPGCISQIEENGQISGMTALASRIFHPSAAKMITLGL